jgi:hypothetical protein
MEMETWKHGDIDIETYVDIETWKHGEMETWRHGGMETGTWNSDVLYKKSNEKNKSDQGVFS